MWPRLDSVEPVAEQQGQRLPSRAAQGGCR